MFFFCNYQIDSRAIKYFNIYKLYFKGKSHAPRSWRSPRLSSSTCGLIHRSNIAFHDGVRSGALRSYQWWGAFRRRTDGVAPIDFFYPPPFLFLLLGKIQKNHFICFLYTIWLSFFWLLLFFFVFYKLVFLFNYVPHHLISFDSYIKFNLYFFNFYLFHFYPFSN